MARQRKKICTKVAKSRTSFGLRKASQIGERERRGGCLHSFEQKLKNEVIWISCAGSIKMTSCVRAHPPFLCLFNTLLRSFRFRPKPNSRGGSIAVECISRR